MFKQKKGEDAPAIDLKISFELEHLVLAGDGFKFRIPKEDIGLLLDPRAVQRSFEDAGGIATRRIFDGAAVERFCKIARFLSHGLSMTAIGKLINESESDCRDFYSWALNESASRREQVKQEKARLAREDVLPLVKPRASFRPGEEITEIPVNALDIKRLLKRDISKDGQGVLEILGVSHGDLNAWLSANADMMALL